MLAISKYLFKSEDITSNLDQKIDTTKRKSVPQFHSGPQEERWRNKYEQNLKNKQKQIQQLTNKCDALSKQLNRLGRQNKKISLERDRSQQITEQNILKIQQLEGKIQTMEKLTLKKQDQFVQIKSKLKDLQLQVGEERQKFENQAKQHKIAMRRNNLIFEQSRLNLQSKLTIKQKQQERTEEILLQKKSQFEQALLEKEGQIIEFREQNQTLRMKCESIELQLQLLQKENINEYSVFQGEIQTIIAQLETQQNKYTSLYQKINQSLKAFCKDLLINCWDGDLFQFIQKCKEVLLVQKEQFKKGEQQRAKICQKLSLQLEYKRSLEKDLMNKNTILLDEIAFLKERLNKNNDFAAIIKSHLSTGNSTTSKAAAHAAPQQISQKIREVERQRKQYESKQNFRNGNKLKKEVNNQSLAISSNINISEYMKIKSIAKLKKIQFQNRQHLKAKSVNDILKEQLQSKRRSLIYLMYNQTSNQQQNNGSKEFQYRQKGQINSTRKRSHSLVNLISKKCREQTL